MENKWFKLFRYLKDNFSYTLDGKLNIRIDMELEKFVDIIRYFLDADDKIISLRKAYFSFRDKLHLEGSTGYSKVELHELAKKSIFPKLVENPDNFIEGGKDQKQFSVTWLSEQGWISYIEEFKLFCAENFNVYL